MAILHLDASINSKDGPSSRIAKSIVDQLTSTGDGEEVIYRNLNANPCPRLTFEAFTGKDALNEFLNAATVVINAPICNLALAHPLKAWIDGILVAGKTFRYTGKGPEGLVRGKRVIVALARGDVCASDSSAASPEHIQTYLREVFNFVGVEAEFVAADGLRLALPPNSSRPHRPYRQARHVPPRQSRRV